MRRSARLQKIRRMLRSRRSNCGSQALVWSLAAHKTKAFLLLSRKKVETQRAVKYLGVLLDTRLCFKEHLQYAQKVSGTAGALARMLLTARGPKQNTRRLLVSVVTSQLLYAAPVWAEAAGSRVILS
nr:uncharacterized protein LOC121502091 [Drosophila kikkawai]